MEQLYEMWLKSQKPEKGEDPASQVSKENGKQIHMPTDYAEVTVSPEGPAVPLDSDVFLGAGLSWFQTRSRVENEISMPSLHRLARHRSRALCREISSCGF